MALLMAGLMVLVAISFSASAATRQQQPTETGSISGEVTTLLGDPIEDATVYYGGVGVAEGQINIAWGNVTTNENGEYTISDLAGGVYGLFVMKPGHTPSGRVVHLSPGENKNSVDFNLIKIPGDALIQQQQAPLSR